MLKIEYSSGKRHPNFMTRGMDVGGSSLPVDLQSREILVAVASLLRVGRHEMALAVLDDELGRGC